LGIAAAVAALEAKSGVSFINEGARYLHRASLFPLVEAAVRARTLNELAHAFAAAGVCWSRYQGLAEAVSSSSPLFTANPIFSTVSHAGTGSYLTPGAAVRIPQEERARAASAPYLGEHTDEVLSDLLGLNGAEIGRLRDEGLVA
jgi:2-methylfumaryl-CoA isomerase